MASDHAPSRPSLTDRRTQSIRIRRLPSGRVPLATVAEGNRNDHLTPATPEMAQRRRSLSAPDPVTIEHDRVSNVSGDMPELTHMESVVEETQTPGGTASHSLELPKETRGRSRRSTSPDPPHHKSRKRRRSRSEANRNEYDARIIDFLDVVDPEVSTLSTLTNVQNSLFVPDLGRFLNRMPTYELSRHPTYIHQEKVREKLQDESESRYDHERGADFDDATATLTLSQTRASINSVLSESRFAVLPHGTTLEGWSDEDKEMLNDHVRHMLHSRREKIKRGIRGFGQYIRKREFYSMYERTSYLTIRSCSSWILRYLVRISHYRVWSCLGAVSHRYDPELTPLARLSMAWD